MMPKATTAGDCASLVDCYATAQTAIVALVCLTLLIGVLLGLTAAPLRPEADGQVQGWWDRLLGLAPEPGGQEEAAAEVPEAAELTRPRRRHGAHRA